MEIKELLEIMLDNVNQGKSPDHGLVGYNGAINLEQPEHVYRKPHTYITFDEFREIMNTNGHNTTLNRLNLAIEKLMVVRATPVEPVVFPVPNGFYVDDQKIPTYQEMRSLGYYDSVLKLQGWLKEYAQLPSMAPSAPPPLIKPYVDWVGSGCNHVWPNPNYLFAESQFSNIKNSEFRVKLVEELNRARAMGKPFAGIVRNTYLSSNEAGYKTMEELVNNTLNKIYLTL